MAKSKTVVAFGAFQWRSAETVMAVGASYLRSAELSWLLEPLRGEGPNCNGFWSLVAIVDEGS